MMKAYKSFNEPELMQSTMNVHRFYCKGCNTHLLHSPWPGAVFLNSKMVENPLPNQMYVSLEQAFPHGDYEKEVEALKAKYPDKLVSHTEPEEFREIVMSTHPMKNKELNMKCPRFIGHTYTPHGDPDEYIFTTTIQPHKVNPNDVDRIGWASQVDRGLSA